MNVYDLPTDFPNYRQVNVGDIFIWYVGDEDLLDKEGNKKVHGHWLQVVHKGTRTAEVDVKHLRCDNPSHTDCHIEMGRIDTYGWSKLEYWQHKTRWLRTPGAKILYGERYGSQS